ncbi:sulfatase-like hydrolase/transferase [Mucilaginibacter sp. OK098]|uniref:sulfatase-like hydrolase/transferase n=1 Tax=Mucilaginibacter sp. OK098 TaxID=1855297 RepID=UPI000916A2A9|nr:sulfatase-like hydrolase/transferase [Mucilaginibacter sp. OK098]SHM52417.1 Arylsulfatase A [Mucilaginibacter sp. OK098]
MKKTYLLITVFLLVFSNILTVKAQKKPNIIFILTDDLGYGDLGVFFQNKRQQSGDRSKPYELTPNLDLMAKKGAKFTQQYCNAPVCAPSRASLLTGVNQGNANIRDNQFDKALENNHTLATLLKQAGYNTTAIGKWGLQGINGNGPDWQAHPVKRGFDSYYGYIRHKDGHEHYPFEGLYDGKKQVWSDYKEVSANLSKCYTTDLWTAAAKNYIIAHQKGSDAVKPFFMYLAYDCPHAVLELPTQAYPSGKGLKGGLQWLGEPGHMINTATGKVDSYVYPEYANATYDDDNNPATPEIAWPETYKRYASAVRRIDDAVGDILQLLVDLKIADNTLVIFTSDNGPSIESYLPASFVPNHPTFFGSYGPFDGIKRDCWEGGLRMPTLAEWPDHIAPGKTITTPSMLSDWMATFADVAHIQPPARTDGVSLLPDLTGKGKQQNSLVYVEYYEEGKTPVFKEFEASRRNRKRDQMQMIRMGNLVGVRYQVKAAGDDFEIYDVVNDPKETDNLALKTGFEKIQAQMKANVLQVRHADAEAPRPYDNAMIPADSVLRELIPGLNWKFYEGNFPWVIAEKNLKESEKGTGNNITRKEAGKKEGMTCYEGFIKIPADGKYTFSMLTTGKAYLRLHEATLIDEDFGYQPNTEVIKDVYLKAGYHAIKLNYLLPKGISPQLKLKWKSDKNDWMDLDAKAFYHYKTAL